MDRIPDRAAVGSLLRHLLELTDGELAALERERGMADYRPRFSPVVRTLAADGPMSIRDLAVAVGVTHSAASQTVAQMVGNELVTLRPGVDARQRIVHLTDRARTMLPAIKAEWDDTAAAMRELDAELPMPLAEVLSEAIHALRRRGLRERIADHHA